MKKYVIGLDYGTDSCRAIVADSATGEEIASSVKYYPRWAAGKYCDAGANRYRQHPLDYTETLESSVREALERSPAGTASLVAGIGVDTTGSTPVLTDDRGVPLALLPEFAENPNAMFILWKDHTAIAEAAEINALSKRWDTDYTACSGGVYSPEWVWAKALHVLRSDGEVRKAARSWVEHCDWIPALLTGNTRPENILRSRCAAGHKALWHADWGGLPPEAFFTALDPLLSGWRACLFTETFPGDRSVGKLTKEWAERLGLSTETTVAAGVLDCHTGAVGAQIAPGVMVRVIGTSTCDVMVASREEIAGRLIPGICGQVDGSVIPGMVGLEAGQSAFGDVYAWFKRVVEWPVKHLLSRSQLIDEALKSRLTEEILSGILPALSEEAGKIPAHESSILATDWLNGRRTPDADPLLKGTLTGLTLGSSAPLIFRALVEATAYGSKAIADRFIENGLQIGEVTAIGGITHKSPFVMQTLANVLGMSIKVSKAEQACALGSAMFAAVASGVHPTVGEAQKAMGRGFSDVWRPDPAANRIYAGLYEKYRAMGKWA
ncbi:MAG: ribulokinase [Bacteroidales bacterium]|jgi:L-ribulokinase|nr:ribulokinase [Bacteroidales bacterium]